VGGVFAIGYRLSLIRLLLLAFFFCGGIELLQVPLPTRHARIGDLVVDFCGACFALGCAVAAKVAFPDGSMSATGLHREAQRDVSL